jgi:pimeloyl-ACP methyl ester carboxylesterase
MSGNDPKRTLICIDPVGDVGKRTLRLCVRFRFDWQDKMIIYNCEAMHQHIQYCTTPDGVRLAYSIMGKGSSMVRTPHWFAHLAHDLESPVFRHMLLGRSRQHSLLRYDARGIGLSQRDNVEISFAKWVSDLEAVIDCAKLDRFILLGFSQGAAQAIAYAARHPERLTHLILYGGFTRGLLHRENPEKQKEILELACALVRNGWGSDDESYRQFFTSQFIPEADRELQRSLNEMQRLAATPYMADRFMRANADVNVVGELSKIKTPTLVMHTTGDLRVPYSFAQEIAAGIPGAKLVPLESRNHIVLPDEPAHRAMSDAIADFLGDKRLRGALPGTAPITHRLDAAVGSLQRNWLVKLIVVAGALGSAGVAFLQVWRMLGH